MALGRVGKFGYDVGIGISVRHSNRVSKTYITTTSFYIIFNFIFTLALASVVELE
jgi:hypothetical protein